MESTQHRANVVLDEAIIQEALKLGNIKTKRALIDVAIREFIATRKKNSLNNLLDELKGQSPFYEDYDYKTMRERNLPEFKE